MSLSIVAAKDMEQAIELLASRPRKAVKDHLAEEPEGVGNFLYDFRAAFTNYQGDMLKGAQSYAGTSFLGKFQKVGSPS